MTALILYYFSFSKPFTPQYLIGGVIVVAGVYLNATKSSSRLSQPSILMRRAVAFIVSSAVALWADQDNRRRQSMTSHV